MDERTMTEQERRRGIELVRHCDAYDLLTCVLEESVMFGEADRQRARELLWVQRTLAYNRLKKFNRELGYEGR